ncbi:hypothetical protein [Helicobacter rodentium]|uniref:hypothetical protein n=1 Tax=Helicobacter rodentium TaxID=59617 RepID=UPI0023F1EE7C|nr:hypothetical protein [Helicobacter rodentium]
MQNYHCNSGRFSVVTRSEATKQSIISQTYLKPKVCNIMDCHAFFTKTLTMTKTNYCIVAKACPKRILRSSLPTLANL